MRLKLLAPAAASAAILIGMTAAPAQATHSWGGYHWATSNGNVTKTIYSNLTPDWAGNVTKADSDWNVSTHLQNTVVAGDTSARARKRCTMVSGAIKVCNASYGNNGWAGLASINISGLHITQGTAKMNDTYEATSPLAERQGVMCQEVGHNFGLDHQDTNFTNANLGTCMDYTNDWSTNQSPNQHDYDELGVIYNHVDAGAAPAGSTAGVTRINTGNTVTMVTWAN